MADNQKLIEVIEENDKSKEELEKFLKFMTEHLITYIHEYMKLAKKNNPDRNSLVANFGFHIADEKFSILLFKGGDTKAKSLAQCLNHLTGITDEMDKWTKEEKVDYIKKNLSHIISVNESIN